TAVVNLDELMSKCCRLILERFVVDHVAVLLDVEGRLQLTAHQGKLTACVPQGATLATGAGLTSEAIATGKPVLQNDVMQDPKYVPWFNETRSEISVPLLFFGEKLGALVLECAQPHAFASDDLPSLEAVADICAGAIFNARHFEKTRQLAYLDGLTGIFNRRFFELRIAEEMERANRYGSQVAVV